MSEELLGPCILMSVIFLGCGLTMALVFWLLSLDQRSRDYALLALRRQDLEQFNQALMIANEYYFKLWQACAATAGSLLQAFVNEQAYTTTQQGEAAAQAAEQGDTEGYGQDGQDGQDGYDDEDEPELPEFEDEGFDDEGFEDENEVTDEEEKPD